MLGNILENRNKRIARIPVPVTRRCDGVLCDDSYQVPVRLFEYSGKIMWNSFVAFWRLPGMACGH